MRRGGAGAVVIAIVAIACADVGGDDRLSPGAELVREGTIELMPFWWNAPLFFESAPVCPVPDGTPMLRTSYDAFTFEAESDVVVSATLERMLGTRHADDSGLVVYAGSEVPGGGVPGSDAEARACLAMDYASGDFPGEVEGVMVAAGERITIVLSTFSGDAPIDYRLTVRASAP